MDNEMFIKRLSELRLNKGVSAREMSLALGQSAGYINNIENGINLPSMSMFFYICEYLNIEPKNFFDITDNNPTKTNELAEVAKTLNNDKIDILITLAKGLQK